MSEVLPPRLEGTVRVAPDRVLGWAQFGDANGLPFIWLHGTPGARRQIPPEARTFALRHGMRIVGIDRPGVGKSTPHLYANVREFADDVRTLADAMGFEKFAVIGLSGGGPYALACAATMPDRVVAVASLGGVAPTVGPNAIHGGLVGFGERFASVVKLLRVPLGFGLATLLKVLRPVGNPALHLYARVSPPGDRALLERPEFAAMFLDDILGRHEHFSAALSDVVLFCRDWGFELSDVKAPVVWWHGDADHIIPFSHGQHMVERLPDAELRVLPGESHLGGLGIAEEILTTLSAHLRDPQESLRRAGS
ncbi:MAG TPA: alpha/beta hydrolase [Mycobacteriales bacterium]|nr:alpha/beta hydrolase [Mycobacteriales bacterium]